MKISSLFYLLSKGFAYSLLLVPILTHSQTRAEEKAVLELAVEQPAPGQLRASNELKKRGVFISQSGVRCVWLRRYLETFKKRLKALEQRAAEEGLVLTESQLSALERAREEKQAQGEIETHHLSYLGT